MEAPTKINWSSWLEESNSNPRGASGVLCGRSSPTISCRIQWKKINKPGNTLQSRHPGFHCA